MRALLRPLEGLVSGDHDATLPPGEDRLRLLIGGAEWIRRTDYLGSPIRIAGALAVLLPVYSITTASSIFALVTAFGLSALSAVAFGPRATDRSAYHMLDQARLADSCMRAKGYQRAPKN